jgi:integrase
MSKRRGRGEGSIFQRSDGKWAAEFTSGYDSKGKRIRKTVYGKTKKEVQEKLLKKQAASVGGVQVNTEKLTVSQFSERWLNDTVKDSRRPATYIQYERAFRLYINPFIGGMQLSKLTPMNIQALYAQLARLGKSARQRQIVHVVLQCSLNLAVSWRLIPRNPCHDATAPRVPKKPIQKLTKEQVAVFLNAAKGDRLYALYLLAVTTGLRQGEMLGLHWSEVDLEAGTISVQYSLTEVSGMFFRAEPKTDKGRRLVHLPAITIEALKAHRQRMKEEGHTGPWVFCGPQGGVIRKSNLLYREFHPLLEKAGLPTIKFHALRHTAATLMLGEHIPMKMVQERLGHSQIAVTADIYSHYDSSMDQGVAVALDNLFENL